MAKEKTESELPDAPPAPTPAERVESWKDIAAYLQRDVRTVQRWEKREGLPVYRHMHDKLGTVYAYKMELDAWWSNRRPKLEAKEAEEGRQAMAIWKRRAVAAAAVAIVAAAVAGWWWTREPALPFEERGWVLIAQFENRTGEEVFDGTLEYALERELSNSRFVNVVPRERVNDALRLMKQPLDSPITAAVGREVALRDGGIRAFLTGGVKKLDNTYVLSASLVNPADGRAAASFSEEAMGQREVVPALRRLSAEVRSALGENISTMQPSRQNLEKVTTPSLRALQLYSRGMDLVNARDWESAAEVLQRAVAEDPDFASAHILLAHCLSNLGRHEAAAPHYQRAFALADTTTDRERYFILGSYHARFRNDQETALRAYQALVRLYPDHYWGVNNLAITLSQLGRAREAVEFLVRLAELRPHDFHAQINAARAVIRLRNDISLARPHLNRAQALMTSANPFDLGVVWVRLFPAYASWAQGDVAAVQQQLTLADETFRSQSGGNRTYPETFLGNFYLTLGQLRRAEQHYQQVHDLPYRHHLLARIAFARGDNEALKQHLRFVPPHFNSPTTAVLYVKAGLLTAAEKRVPYFRIGPVPELIRGELALARGQVAEGVSLLEEALRVSRGGEPNPTCSLSSEALAGAYEQRGEMDKALAVLETASQEKAGIYGDLGPIGYFWMRTQLRLAQLYRKLGRNSEAENIEAELRKLLVLADPDHPILLELERSRQVAAAQPTH